MTSSSLQRDVRAVLLLLAALSAVPAHARVHHSEAWARDRFAVAERMREALNGRPPADRARHDYQRVVNNYRSVYMGAPTSTRADPSVVAVAETMVEMGRRFDDDSILNKAIDQYKFLRREYPGSKYRFDALFTIGEIFKDDLDDAASARAAFQEFLRRYPHNRLADDAQQAINEIDEAEAETAAEAEKTAKNQKALKNEKAATRETSTNSEPTAASKTESPDHPPARLPRVTGIRHWSTPDYTRVAIDLESGIDFKSQRIANPDRIFFDLPDTKLASTLVGKSFDVDDGFLKKIRVAQFQPGRTRVVLEVDNLSDYDAFLLPNPYRLIIDIHGKNAKGKAAKDASQVAGAVKAPPAADEDSPDQSPDTRARGKTGDASEDAADSAKLVHTAVPSAKKPQASTVKKVIVEADDDDPAASAVQTAKLDSPAMRSGPAPAAKTAKHSVTADSESDNTETRALTSSPSDHAPRKSLARRKTSKASNLDIHEARPTSSGDRSLIRALGLKIGRIVIDPGHGGHDTGTIGPNGLEEKDLVLEVGRRLGKLLETRLGAEVVYTRKDDTFIPLETRTAIANQARADLFVSIHANSSGDPSARGVETYYLNFTSSPEALEVAARENAVSEKSIYELQDLVKKIALKEKIEESHEFASDVQESLHTGLATKSPAIRDRGVKKAPFIVLIGANMPSILAEISFVSNPTDERRLETSEYRQRIAESLYRGIAKYVNGLSGVKVASKMDKPTGQ